MHQRAASRKTPAQQTVLALPLAALLVGNVTLAFGPWFVRLADVGPVAAGFWRLALAVPLLVALAYATARRPFAPARRFGWTIAFGGLAFAADLGTWHFGILRTSLANATLFGNCATLMYPIYGFLVARAWPSRIQALALALAAAGGGLLLGRSYEYSPDHLFGDLLCLLAGLAYTGYIILMVRVRETTAPVPALALSTIASVVPLLLAAFALGEQVWPEHWGALICLALLSQVIGQGLMIYAIGHVPPLVVGIALLSQPIVAGTVGWIVYGEKLGPADFVGAVLVAIALVLVRSGGPRVAPGAEGSKPA